MTPAPGRDEIPSHLEQDVRNQAARLTTFFEALTKINQELAVLEEANKHRDEKLNSILSLGRTVLITVLTLAIGAGFAWVASGGLNVTAG